MNASVNPYYANIDHLGHAFEELINKSNNNHNRQHVTRIECFCFASDREKCAQDNRFRCMCVHAMIAYDRSFIVYFESVALHLLSFWLILRWIQICVKLRQRPSEHSGIENMPQNSDSLQGTLHFWMMILCNLKVENWRRA